MLGNYYTPTGVLNTPVKFIHVTYEKINGVNTAVESEDSYTSYCSAKSYGGSEKVINDQYTIVDTMEFVTYYDPNVKSQDRVKILSTGDIYEILNTPENIDLRGAFMKFKARRWHG